MANNDTTQDTVQKIDPNASQTDIIDTLNENFQKLTKRIKNNNINISFLDLLRLDTVWSGTYDGTTPDIRLQNFISTVWNTLANYSGVLIQYTATSADASAFTYANATVNNGDYLVKLPGAQFVHVPGQDANYYQPSDFDYANGSITYTLVNTSVSRPSITFSSAASSGYSVATGTIGSQQTVTISGTLKSMRWYSSGEEVLWSNSYATLTNSTSLTLNYIAIYK